MKSEKNILIAFILNLSFSVFELVGGIMTGSIAITSDSIHDLIDAIGIGTSYFLERKSRKMPDEKYTYGYLRYSLLGSIIITLMLFVSSSLMICNSIKRIIFPCEIDYNGMIVLAIVGIFVNMFAAYFTRDRSSLNQKAVNLHMLEDVMGWCIVLVGAVVMRFTNFAIIDPIMSICVSVFIIVNAVGNLKEASEYFFEKAPCNIKIGEIEESIKGISGVFDVHHIHVWSMDGQANFATMHIVTASDSGFIKKETKAILSDLGISHSTLELETLEEICEEKICLIEMEQHLKHGHHHDRCF